jgi:hypothetical protein
MKFPQIGGCQCGALRYEVRKAPQLVYTCHCTECQRLTGSAFSMALVVATGAFHLTGTQPRPFFRIADSERRVTRWLCPVCGTWIWSGPKPDTAERDALRVRAGTLDDTSWLRPTVISGPAANGPGSRCPKVIGGSKRNQRTLPGCGPDRRNDRGEPAEICRP